MGQLIVKGGYVYDPLNNIKGDRMDIAVRDGKIVSPTEINEREAKVIDASNMLVMAGGIDLHSHIAGPKVNAGRIMRPEDHYRVWMRTAGVRRSGSGRTTPSTNMIGYKYARLGYTTVFEAATPPLETRHTHEELDDIPIIDKGCMLLLDSNWFVLNYIARGEADKLSAFVAWMLSSLKSYAIKIVDPGAAEAWSEGKGVGLDLDEQIPRFNLTPRDIVRGLCKVNETLKLPHSIHIHCNRLGFPGNVRTTLKTIEAVSDIPTRRARQTIHITHTQFTGYDGDSWATLESGGERIAKLVNARQHVTLDIGQIVWGDATTMTADAPFEFVLHHLAPGKWSNSDVEVETSAGIVPFKYKRTVPAHQVMWCIGLEVSLLVKDVWKILPTTDHPNAGPFTRYPLVFMWLMSKRARDEVSEKFTPRTKRRIALPAIDREYDFYELAIVTRAAQAKVLGIEKFKGHLGLGAYADLAIYDIDPTRVDPSREPLKVRNAFQRAKYTVKSGEIVVRDGEIVNHFYGRTLYVKPKVRGELLSSVKAEVGLKFKDWYSVSLKNYVMADEELKKPWPVEVETLLT